MNAIVKAGEIMEAVITRGDLANLTAEERAKYYVRVCESLGLNPMTKPFEYITLNGRLVLYARKDATDQLRQLHGISVTDLTETEREGVFVVTAKVANAQGRTDAAKGAVNIGGLKGEALANAMMKAETKAKRRATLSICGLGFLDETEIEDIPAETKSAPGRAPRVLKKDTRDDYIALQAEMDEASTSIAALDRWMNAAVESVRKLPSDWQETLRFVCGAKLTDLKLGREVRSSQEIIEERACGNLAEQQANLRPDRSASPEDDGIPPFLRREQPKPNGHMSTDEAMAYLGA